MDYHKILGTTSEDSEEYVTSRYRELSMVWHPDKCGKYDTCTEDRKQLFNDMQRDINEAYRAVKQQIRSQNPSKESGNEPFYLFGLKFDMETLLVLITQILISMLVVFGISKLWQFLKSRGYSIFAWVKVGCLAGLGYFSYLSYGESEYADVVLFITVLFYLQYLSPAMVALYNRLKSLIWHALSYWVAILTFSCGGLLLINSTGIAFVRTATVLLCIGLFSIRDVLGFQLSLLLLLLIGFSISQMSVVSDSFGTSFVDELKYELEMLYIYGVIFVFGFIFNDSKIQEATMALSSCMQKRNCSSGYVNNLLKYIESYVSRQWYEYNGYLPYLIMGIVSFILLYRLIKNAYQYVKCTATRLFPSSFSLETVDGARKELTRRASDFATIADLDQGEISVIKLMAEHDLSEREARQLLQSREWDVDRIDAYLSSPAGKANLAALRRQPDILVSNSRRDVSNKKDSSQNRYVLSSQNRYAPRLGICEEYS